MSNVIPFPTTEDRELVRGDRAFREAAELASYDLVAAIQRMMRLCDDGNAPEVRLCASHWLLENCDVRVAF